MLNFAPIPPASNLLYQRYRFIALAVYGAVLLAGLLDWVYGGLGPRSLIQAPETFRFGVFALMVLGLIGLEWAALGGASFAIPNQIEPWPLLGRIVLFLGAGAVTDLSYSQLLFLPLLLYSYLAIDPRLSYGMAIAGVATLFGLDIFEFVHVSPGPPPGAGPDLSFPLRVPLVGGTISREWLIVGRLMDKATVALITLFFTFLLARAMIQAIQDQQKLTGLLASLEASNTQLQQYASQVADLAAAEERNRLARDIHDSLGHHLAAINIQLAKAGAYRQRDPNRAEEAIHHAQHAVQDALKDVRESVGSLRQGGENFDFEAALEGLIRRMDHSNLTVQLHQTGERSRYSRLKLMTLYRVMQEGLTNVHKHANASQVEIRLDFGPEQVTLDLRDDGVGFDIQAAQVGEHKSGSHGLQGLRERLSLVEGRLHINSQSQGTTLAITIPQADAYSGRGEVR